MITRFISYALGISLVLLMGCGNSGQPSIDTSPNASNISGSVFLYGEGTERVDNSGMTVTVENSDPVRSAATGTDGKFVIADVPLGNHTLVFSKSGYGTFKMFDVAHVADDRPTVITAIPSLGAFSSTEVTGLAATVSGESVVIEATTTPAGNAGNSRYLRFFLDTDPDVSNVLYTVYSAAFVSKSNPFEKTFTKAELQAMGFTSGTTVYIRVYGDSYWSNQYDDPGLDRHVFPNLNTNSVAAVSVTIP